MRVETVNSQDEFKAKIYDYSSNQDRVQIVLESGSKDVTQDELKKEIKKQLLAKIVSGKATIKLRLLPHGAGYAKKIEIRYWEQPQPSNN